MDNVIKALIGLSALAFLIAVFGSLAGTELLHVEPEGYSRACSNLALIAIALSLVSKK